MQRGVYLQRSTVKVAYARNGSGTRWAAHGRYLGRESARSEGEPGQGFDAEREDVELETTLGAWQCAGDAHVFKVIVSPENGADMDLQGHARALVERMEKDLGTPLEWAGVVHTNTGHPHVHLVIRGRDADGEPLVIDREYIAHGIRMRSRELATQELGLRLERDWMEARERAIERRGPTEIDRALVRRAGEAREVSMPVATVERPAQKERRIQEMRRLHFLTQLGLAEKTGARTWMLSPDLESGLREIERMGDISRTLANGRVLVSKPNAQVSFDSLREPGRVVTGRLVGSGLDERRPEPVPYLLVEGTDGLVHCVAGPARSPGLGAGERIDLDSIVTLEAREARRSPGRRMPERTAVVVTADAPAETVGSRRPPLALDLEVIEEARAGAPRPSLRDAEIGFAGEWSRRRETRREELISAGVLQRGSDGAVRVAPDWIRRLDAERLGARTQGRASRESERGPSVAGRVVTRSAGGFELRDLQGRGHVVRLREVGLRTAPGVGVELWIQPRERERALARGEVMREERRERSRETERGGGPARAERLRASELRGGPDRWTKADEILAREGAVAETAGESPAVQALREREELWRRRGIAIDEQFERRARQWLEERFRAGELESLPEAARRLGRPVRPLSPEMGVTVRGRLVGFARENGVRHALVDTGREVRALPAPEARVEIGRSVLARPVGVEAENRRGRQLTWRLDELERTRDLQRGRGR